MWQMIKDFVQGIGKVIKSFWENYQEEILQALQLVIVLGLCVGLFYIAGPLLFPMMTASLGMLLGSSTLGVLTAVSLSAIMMITSIAFAGYMLKRDVVSKGFDWLGDKWRNWGVVHPKNQVGDDAEEEEKSNRKTDYSTDKKQTDSESDEEEDDDSLIDKRKTSAGHKWKSQPSPHHAKNPSASSNSSNSSNGPPSYTVEEPDGDTYTVTPSSNPSNTKN